MDLWASYFETSSPKPLLKLELRFPGDLDAFEKFSLNVPYRLCTLLVQCNIFLRSLWYPCPISVEMN